MITTEIRQICNDYPYDLLLEADPSKELVDKYLSAGECWVAVDNDEVIAVYILMPQNDIYEIMNVSVKNCMQGKGIGKEMVLHACNRVKELGGATVTVGTADIGVGHISFYEKCGFKIAGVKKNFFIDNYKEPVIDNGKLCRHMVMLSKVVK